MKITVNNKQYEANEGVTIFALISELGYGANGVAVAMHDTVIPRVQWGEYTLSEGDSLIIFQAVSGG